MQHQQQRGQHSGGISSVSGGDDERARLLERGRKLLNERLATRGTGGGSREPSPSTGSRLDKGTSSASSNAVLTLEPPLRSEEVETLRAELDYHLKLSDERHHADVALIEDLERQLTMMRKQLHQVKESTFLSTPLRSTSAVDQDGVRDGDNGESVNELNSLRQQLVNSSVTIEQNRARLEEVEGKNAELEQEALALCKTIADMQNQMKDRDEQLAASLARIDELEERQQQQPHLGTTAAGGARSLEATFGSPVVDSNSLAMHQLDEQVHQLSREKAELERETAGQREIITNLQTQWNELVQQVQQREQVLTAEVYSLRNELEEHRRRGATSSGAAAAASAAAATTATTADPSSRSASTTSSISASHHNEEYVHKSKLEELRQSLYVEFNKHIGQFQEVNNQHWADMVAKHQAELASREERIKTLEEAAAAAANNPQQHQAAAGSYVNEHTNTDDDESPARHQEGSRQEEHDRQQERIETLTSELQLLQQTHEVAVAQHRAERESWVQNNEQQSQKISAMTAELAALREECQRAKMDLEESDQGWRTKVGEVRAAAEATLQAELTHQRDEEAARFAVLLDEKLSAERNALQEASLAERMLQHQSAMTSVSNELDDALHERDALLSQMESLRDELHHLLDAKANAANSSGNAATEMTTTAAAAAATQHMSQERLVADLTSRVNEAETQVGSCLLELEAAKETILELQSKAHHAANQHEQVMLRLEEALEKANEEVAHRDDAAAAMQESTRHLQEVLTASQDALRTASENLQEAIRERDALRVAYMKLELESSRSTNDDEERAESETLLQTLVNQRQALDLFVDAVKGRYELSLVELREMTALAHTVLVGGVRSASQTLAAANARHNTERINLESRIAEESATSESKLSTMEQELRLTQDTCATNIETCRREAAEQQRQMTLHHSSVVAQLQHQLEQRKVELADLASQRDQYAEDIEFYKQQLDDTEHRDAETNQELSAAREKARVAEERFHALEHHQQQQRTMIDDRGKHAMEMLRQSQSEVASCQSVIASLEERLETQAREVGTLRQELESREFRISTLEDQRREFEEDCKALRKERALLQSHQEHLLASMDSAKTEAAHRLEQAQFAAQEREQQLLHELTTQRALRETERQSLTLELNDTREQMAALQVVNQSHIEGQRFQDQVQALQQQLLDQVRSNHRLQSQLVSAQQEITEKSHIIRDQDFSLSGSIGEHSGASQQAQQFAGRIEELEGKVRKIGRERDSLLLEKDAQTVDAANLSRRLEHKDQAIRRLEGELKAAKAQTQSAKSDAAEKLRRLSDLRQEVASCRSIEGALRDELEAMTERCQGLELHLHIVLTAETLFEEKVMCSLDLNSELIAHGLAPEWTSAMASLAASSQRILKRCDDIEALAQEAVEDGMKQNRDLREQCRSLTARVKHVTDALAFAEATASRIEDEKKQMEADLVEVSDELQSLRAKSSEAIAKASKENAAMQAQVHALTQQVSTLIDERDRLEMLREQDQEALAAERRRTEETTTALRATIRDMQNRAHLAEHEQQEALSALQASAFEQQHELAAVQRQLAVAKSRLDDVVPRLDASETALATTEAQLAEARRSLQSISKQREQELETLHHRIQEIVRENSELTSAVETHRSGSLHAQSAVERLTLQLSGSQDELNKYRERSRFLEEETVRLQRVWETESEDHRTAVQAFEQRVLTMSRTAQSTEASLQEALGERSQMERERDCLEKTKATMEREIHILRAELHEHTTSNHRRQQSLEEQLATITTHHDAAQEQIQRLSSALDGVNQDKRKLMDQLDDTEKLLRDANNHNTQLNRQLHLLKTSSTEEHQRAEQELDSLRGELLSARKAAANSDVRARDAERTCATLQDENRMLKQEFERVKHSLTEDLQTALREKQDRHERAVDLHRQVTVLEAELLALRKEHGALSQQLDTAHQELSDHKQLLFSTSDKARAVSTDKEELAGQVVSLREEVRKQRMTLERKIKELSDQLQEREAEVISLHARLQQGSTALRQSEGALQHQVTDLTMANHQLKNEVSLLTSAKQALEATMELERTAHRKALAEAQIMCDKHVALEREVNLKHQSTTVTMAQLEQQTQQLHEELEAARQHAAEDKRLALASLERVIQADRQALIDARQARERALRACDQAQRERAEAQEELEVMTAQVRDARREVEEVHQELRMYQSIADQVGHELGLLGGEDSQLSSTSHGSSPINNAAGSPSVRRAEFSSLMDRILQRLSTSRRGTESVTLERQQLRDVRHELDVHEQAAQDAAARLQHVQTQLRRLSDRIELQRQNDVAVARSGSTESAASGQSTRESSKERLTAIGFTSSSSRPVDPILASRSRSGGAGSSSGTALGGNVRSVETSSGPNGRESIRARRLALSKLLQQSMLLERCLQSASTLHEAMLPHLSMIEDQLTVMERAMSTPVMATASTPSRTAQASSMMGAEVLGRSVSHGVLHQRVVLSAGMSVIATRVALQTRLLVSMQQQLTRWELLCEQLSVDDLLRPPRSGGSSSVVLPEGAPEVMLVNNPREFANVFSQSDDFAKLSLIAIVSTAPTSSTAAAEEATTASLLHPATTTSNGTSAANSLQRQQRQSRPQRSGGQHEDVQEERRDGADQVSGDDDDDGDSEGAEDGAEEALEDAVKRTRAFQKLCKENKRLYTLVRNLTEKLKVASTQAVVRAASTGSSSSHAVTSSAAARGDHHHVVVGGTGRNTNPAHVPSHRDPMSDVSPIRRDFGDHDDDDDGDEERRGVPVDEDDEGFQPPTSAARTSSNNNNEDDDDDASPPPHVQWVRR